MSAEVILGGGFLVFTAVIAVVIVWQERIKRREHEAFLRWQVSEAGKNFRWVGKDGTGEQPFNTEGPVGGSD